jgi:hypothetical protein
MTACNARQLTVSDKVAKREAVMSLKLSSLILRSPELIEELDGGDQSSPIGSRKVAPKCC